VSERILITGGQGFFGAWIARQLLREGVPFVLFDLAPDDSILRQVLDPPELAALERRFGDVCDRAELERVFAETRPTEVIHLAALQVPSCREDPVRGALVNVIGTLEVFEAACRHASTVEVVAYASSAAVAGPPGDYADAILDDARHLPRTHYGVFKTANEGNARVYWQDRGLPSVGLRPLSAYGVGREIGITSGPTKAIRAAVLGEEFVIPFTGTTGFNFAEDIAADFIACARLHRKGALALNNPGENHTIEEFIAAIEEAVPSARGRVRAEGSPLPVAWNFDESGLASLLGKVPHTPIREGVRRTAERFARLRESGVLR